LDVEKEINDLKERLTVIERPLVNLRLLVTQGNLRGSSKKIAASLPLIEPVHNCGNPDCEGNGCTRYGERLPCYTAWRAELDAYNRLKKAVTARDFPALSQWFFSN
jgi:hypothetical protein